MPIICEGCGQRVAIPAGYRRNKIQCTCGIICTIPESERAKDDEEPARKQPARAAKSSSPVEEDVERWLLDDASPSPSTQSEPPRFLDPEPEESSAPGTPSQALEKRFKCRRCGLPVHRQGECESCDATKLGLETGKEPIWCPSVDTLVEEEEDAAPYTVEGADDVKCPQCCFMLPPGSVLCVRCGFHLKKRKKVAKSYQPIDRTWETNASLSTRRFLFVVGEMVAIGCAAMGVVWGHTELGLFIFFALLITAMQAFLFGTFDRIHLTRDARGRVQLTKQWRFFFIARQPYPINVRTYENISSGRYRDISTWEYAVCLCLLISGILPGLVWWYFAIHKITFHVSLCRDHNYPEYRVYSGWDENQMKEIAYTLRDASGLRYEEG